MDSDWIVMSDLKIIRNKSELDGTHFVELQPGHFNGKHWSDNSIFIMDDHFSYFDRVIKSAVSRYGFYGYTVIKKSEWLEILELYKKLLVELETATHLSDLKPYVDIYGDGINRLIQQRFDDNMGIFKKTVQELVDWIEEQLKNKKCITIIGL
ncbi:hypothetical protein [Endozoicomonas sp. ALC020]|uniref:hypothetical protein n=1 Tax=unclassified Endozoicomonas TaxID=2644528 RepID=UPI003BAE4262